ncbi:ABC transporter permease [Kineosporia babensis]|uniref:ABC transporter permease n=1 Tax=Kineosporia babensis TaxID=499548 RepID=A0A9X1SYE9_9ACTN|nr:ABC transporter permease [Kineosporia babensis]
MSTETVGASALARPAGKTTRKNRKGSYLADFGLPLLVLALIIGFAYFVTYVVLAEDRRFLLPPLHEVIQVSFLDADNRNQILEALWRTTVIAMVGLAISVLLGTVFAVVMASARWLERSLFPYAVVLQAIPILALVPLMGFWFGFGFTARVIVCVICSIFPIIANTLFGLQSVEPGHRDLFRLRGAKPGTVLTKLLIPAALPSVFTGLRISAGASVIGAIVGDTYFRQGDPGIGILIDLFRSRLQSEQLFGAIIASSLLGIVVFAFFTWLSRRLVGHWHASGRL